MAGIRRYHSTTPAARAAAAVLVAALAWAPTAAAAPRPLQPLVDAASPGDVVTPPPGTYAGPVVVDKRITLDGGGKVTVDAGGDGTVLTIRTDGATVRGLRLINSGDSHNDIDAGVRVRGNYNVVKDNLIENTLFGIDLQQSNSNVVRRNTIRPTPFELGVRGDAVRLWYSRDNKIEQNVVQGARDLVVWYSADNLIAGNEVSGGRYGLHFMYSQYNLVRDNRFHGNSVGVFLMYSDGVVLRGNVISHGQGATGMGIGLKESSDVTIEGNEIYYCATGIYSDVSPFQPETTNLVTDNHVAFNGIGVLFHNDWTGNVLHDNRFDNNLVQVSVNAQASAVRNDWTGNYWDDYRGFDRDGDGIGDTPYAPRVYADRIWMDVPFAAFFRASPVLSLLDFLERLAPFSEPITLLRDDKPKVRPDVVLARAAEPAAPAAKEAEEVEESDRIDPFGLKERLGKKYKGE
ncbi:MAG: nitrous oxide reductase family maturation protein NosD [Hyphomicrobiales bacterium]|nr:nitrous oxide reductase family maturation protein NosD [Hyphomicrobiales bacterium]MCP5371184.1 nitrous oxide reductase family maturation protein NosD [Hyphomicrobiales bacterium]